MISFDADASSSVLARFVRDLEAQSPRPATAIHPELSRLRDEDIEAGRFGWATRIVDEHRSVVVFSELVRVLGDAEAPYVAMCAVQRLIGDELRHARLCADVVDALGGFDRLEIDLAGLSLPPSDAPPLERALEIVVRELVVAETESVSVLCAYRDATSDRAIREVLQIVLCDEVRHAATGRALARLLEPLVPERDRDRVRAYLGDVAQRDRDYLRDRYRASVHRDVADPDSLPGRALGVALTLDELPF